jgi:hypothetical protein
MVDSLSRVGNTEDELGASCSAKKNREVLKKQKHAHTW